MPLYSLVCYSMLLYAIICMYLGSNSYSVHCSTKALTADAHLAHPLPAASPLACFAALFLLTIIIIYINRFLKKYIIIYISTAARASSLKSP